jgi:hypothetical protein
VILRQRSLPQRGELRKSKRLRTQTKLRTPPLLRLHRWVGVSGMGSVPRRSQSQRKPTEEKTNESHAK